MITIYFLDSIFEQYSVVPYISYMLIVIVFVIFIYRNRNALIYLYFFNSYFCRFFSNLVYNFIMYAMIVYA